MIFERGKRKWLAYVPYLPGCVAAAHCRRETEQHIREVIAFHIEGVLEDGELILEPSWLAEQIALEMLPPLAA